MEKEPKFKIGQTVYRICNEWYDIRYSKFVIKGIEVSRDSNGIEYFIYKDTYNGTSWYKEDKCFATLDDMKEFLSTRIANNACVKMCSVGRYKEQEGNAVEK